MTMTQLVGPDTFRSVVGHFASGVTVVTTRVGDRDCGMTASSVASLSLDPPMMLVCLKSGSSTERAVREAGRYAVNVLNQDQGHLAQQFAAPSVNKFRGVAVHDGCLGVPVLQEALAHIECEVDEQVDGGTHTIFLGHVVRATARPGAPLAYYRGSFGRFEFRRDDVVYAKARQDILDRRYAPDAVLQAEEFAADLAVEPAAVFYALTRLAAEGLVRRDPNRGYVVVPITAQACDEAFDARLAIQLGVVDMAMGRVSQERLAELRQCFENMAAHVDGDRFVDFGGYLDANHAYHEHLVGFAKNSLLADSFRTLQTRAIMARSFGSTLKTSQVFIEVQDAITVAFERGDATLAKSALHEYARLAKQRAHELLDLHGGEM
jgi:flavin reductase (DIM6/NTAB) family NADH-FMN oxidoreductase RutF/DNA-binding GntR family transcriptional regulator